MLPPEILAGPGTHRVRFGDDVIMHCTVDKRAIGDDLEVVWRFRGRKLRESRRVRFRPDNSVIISSTLLSDTGEYACLALNSVGQVDYH